MDQKLLADSVASIRKALEEFLTPSFRELRTETHADIDQLRGDVERLHLDVAQLRGENASIRSEAQQFRAETAVNFAQVREDISGVRGEVNSLRGEVNSLRGEFNSLRSAMERGFSEIGAKLDLQADVQRLKEQVASLQAGQQVKALEAH